MKFEKDLHDELDNLNIPTVLKIQIEENVLSMKKEHCLDKARVKKIIEKFIDANWPGDCHYSEFATESYKEDLLKELGL